MTPGNFSSSKDDELEKRADVTWKETIDGIERKTFTNRPKVDPRILTLGIQDVHRRNALAVLKETDGEKRAGEIKTEKETE